MCRILLQQTKVNPVSSPFLGGFELSCPLPRLGIRNFRRAAPGTKQKGNEKDACRQGGRGREGTVSLVSFSFLLNYVRLGRTDILYPAIWDSALSCDMSLPPLPITRPSSTVIKNEMEKRMMSKYTGKHDGKEREREKQVADLHDVRQSLVEFQVFHLREGNLK